MRVEDFTFEVRDENLNRLGQLMPSDLVGWESVLRFNNVGTWKISLVANLEMAKQLSTPGYGIIVTHKTAGVILSGPTISSETVFEAGDPIGVMNIVGVDDSVILADRLAYPSPSVVDVSAQTSAYDSVSFMPASSAMYHYVERNLVPGAAPTERAIPSFSIATDTGFGTAVSKSARFDILGELLVDLASIDGLGFDIKQVNDGLVFSVFEPVDRSLEIRMDVANHTLSKTSYGYGAPELTHAIVAGQGEGLARQFIDVTTTQSLNAETLFGRRIERFIDQRNTSDPVELEQAGLEKLSEGGVIMTSVDVIPSSDQTMRYGEDWNLGDRVSVVVAEQEVSATVTQVTILVQGDGVFVGATVGEPNGVDFDAIVAKKTTKQQTRVNALERKDVPAIVWNDAEGTYEFVMKGGNVTQQIGAEQLTYVKNNTGATLLNGRAVYPNGSTGVNKLIAYAQANSEVTSTRTFGVLTEDIANGEHGWVTTFGMVHDIDTSALTEGAAVWLSPTVPGGLTSTKPSSPNHMVLIGFCVRSHAVNGSVFVKVQNGFELDELHDVSIASPSSGQVLARNAENTAWENTTLEISAGAGITVSPTAPAAPESGQGWFYDGDGSLYINYPDANSTQWVEAGTSTNGYDDRLTIVESITSQPVSVARMPSGSVIGFSQIRTDAVTSYSFSSATIITELNVPYTPKFADSLLVVQWMITYEANYNSTFRIARDNSLITTSGYQGYNSLNGTNAYSGFAAVAYDSDVASTPNTTSIQYVGPANSTNATVFQIMLTHSSGGTETFRLNRAYTSIGNQNEVGVSTAVIWEIAQ